MPSPNHPTFPEYPEPLKKRVDAFTDEEIGQALLATQGLQYKAAIKLGCSPSLLAMRIKESAYLQAVRVDAYELRLDKAEQVLFECVDEKNLTAVIFTLKTVGSVRGYGEKITHTVSEAKTMMDQIKPSTNLVQENVTD